MEKINIKILENSPIIRGLISNYIALQVEASINLTDEELVTIYNNMVDNNEVYLLLNTEVIIASEKALR